MVLMFIGGAPGSTAGGVKLTTLAVMSAVVRSLLRGDRAVIVFGRTVEPRSVREATAIVFIGGIAVIVSLATMLLIESQDFVPLAFECVSALGTTGLSLGVTADLSAAGRLLLVALMLIGRVGPLTLVLAVGGTRPAPSRYPQESVAIG